MCYVCDKQTNQMNKLEPKLNELKRQLANSFGHMLPWCIDKLDASLQKVSIQIKHQ